MTTPKSISVAHATCAFCGLACDDLTLKTDGKLQVESEASLPDFCRNNYHIASLKQIPSCRIADREVTLDLALEKAATLLKAARSPLFSGLAVDVNGARAIIKLADFQRGILVHMNNPSALAYTQVMREEGWIAATLSEVRNRAELIVVLGTKALANFPRLAERLTHPEQSDFRETRPEFVLIGPWQNIPIPPAIKQCPYRVIVTETSDLESRIQELGQIALSHRDHSRVNAATPMGRLLQRMIDSTYSAVTWTTSEFENPYPEITLQLLSKIIKEINHTTRCVAMPMAGLRGDITFHQVCAWQSGCPSATSFAKGFPEHDPERYNTDKLIAENKVDLLVWVSSLDTTPPPQTDIPTIVIGHPAMQTSTADVYIPVGIPGIDHAGHFFRTDSVVALPLKQVRNNDLLSVAELLDQLWTHIN